LSPSSALPVTVRLHLNLRPAFSPPPPKTVRLCLFARCFRAKRLGLWSPLIFLNFCIGRRLFSLSPYCSTISLSPISLARCSLPQSAGGECLRIYEEEAILWRDACPLSPNHHCFSFPFSFYETPSQFKGPFVVLSLSWILLNPPRAPFLPFGRSFLAIIDRARRPQGVFSTYGFCHRILGVRGQNSAGSSSSLHVPLRAR